MHEQQRSWETAADNNTTVQFKAEKENIEAKDGIKDAPGHTNITAISKANKHRHEKNYNTQHTKNKAWSGLVRTNKKAMMEQKHTPIAKTRNEQQVVKNENIKLESEIYNHTQTKSTQHLQRKRQKAQNDNKTAKQQTNQAITRENHYGANTTQHDTTQTLLAGNSKQRNGRATTKFEKHVERDKIMDNNEETPASIWEQATTNDKSKHQSGAWSELRLGNESKNVNEHKPTQSGHNTKH